MTVEESTITDEDLLPGNDCPICGENIVTWWSSPTSNVADPDFNVGKNRCTIPADAVEVTVGISTGINGDVVVIDHEGPSME